MSEEFKTVLLGKDDNKLEVEFKTKLSLFEKGQLVQSIVESSYIDYITPSEILRDYSYTIEFVHVVAPEFEFPKCEVDGELVVDSNAAYDKIKELDIIREYERNVDCNLYDDLYLAIDEAMEFKNRKLIAMYAQDSATTEALENINSIVEAGLDVMTKLNGILGNINELTTDKGLKKLLCSKKVKELFESVDFFKTLSYMRRDKSTSDNSGNVVNLEEVKKDKNENKD